MSVKNDLKSLMVGSANHEPVVSMYIPLYPSKDSYKFDDTEFNSLLSQAKKQYTQQFGEKDWIKYEKQIKNLTNDIVFDYAQSKTLAVILNKDVAYHYYLPRKIKLQVVVNEKPYILPLVRGYEFMPTYNILNINRSSFKMYEVKNGLVSEKSLDKDAPISANKALNIDTPDEKIRMEQRGGGSYDQFRGTDVKAEATQVNMDSYFRLVDEYVIQHISNRDHLKVVLMATKDDAGEFNKISHNQFLDKEDVIAVPSIINHETLEKATAKINEDFLNCSRENIENEIDIARSKKRYLENVSDIKQASIEGRLDTVVIARDLIESKEDELNEIAINTLIYGGQVDLIKAELINNQSVIGILRGI
ncbi:MAG TPA: hypothetical protein H9861_06585 [Candidatus Ligilactobacillus excrementigallinarum]|uniref:Bacterial archaeo-eukaryotic release factor family 6 domain-containing protein n=1 Tax=Candidatus Ligilactobacillus excrementigallinarum TaxID=2838641 RepID=A0A9D1UXS7_9LACO|nr:hypothetical protein [Candidatus Ligilactobacillus excrementigallinarum]